MSCHEANWLMSHDNKSRGNPNLNLPPTLHLYQMSSSRTVSCFLVGGDRTFPVYIDETQTVGLLKEAIKDKIRYSVPPFDAFNLTLYLIAINKCDKTTRISKLKKLSEDLQSCTPLDEEDSLLDVFGTGPPPGQTYFILIQLPGSESFSLSYSCCR